MKYAICLLMTGMLACSPSKATREERREDLEKDKIAKEEEAAKMRDEIAVKEKEKAALEDENQKKKQEAEKNKAEMEKVRQNLFMMGQWANYVPVRLEENHFRYADGQIVNQLGKVTDQGTIERLRDIVRRQMEKDKGRDILTQCENGYELCLDNQMYLYYGIRNAQGVCEDGFYLIRMNCSK